MWPFESLPLLRFPGGFWKCRFGVRPIMTPAVEPAAASKGGCSSIGVRGEGSSVDQPDSPRTFPAS